MLTSHCIKDLTVCGVVVNGIARVATAALFDCHLLEAGAVAALESIESKGLELWKKEREFDG
jgi:hypothetical protein